MKWIGQVVHGVKTNFSNDGEIYVIADDLYIENVTQDKDIIFKTNNGGTATEVMRIDGSTSRVGIGTSNPSYSLDVASTGSTTLRLTSAGTGAVAMRYENAAGFKSGIVVDNNGTYRVDATNIYLNPTNNVGIGTSSPGVKLEVIGGYDATPVKFLRHATYGNIIRLGRNGVSETANIGYPADATLNFSTAGSERMRITSAGNVGIGTTSPSRNLVVSNTSGNSILGITSSSSGLAQLALGDTDDDNYGQIILDNSSNKLQIQNGGGGVISDRGITLDSSENVGIGTDSPSEKLQIDGNVKISLTNGGNLQFRNGNTANALFSNTYNIIGASGSISDFNTYVYGNNPYSIWTNNTNRLSVTGAGNVGIGTSSPGQKLEVNGNAVVSGNMMLGSSASGEYITRTGSPYRLGLFTNSAERISVINGGNVGIGTTSPGHKLSISGGNAQISHTEPTLFFNDTTTGHDDWKIYADWDKFYIQQYVGDSSYSTRLMSDASGNIGIGTTSPSVGLQLGNNSPGQTKLAIFNSEGGNENGLTIQSRVNRARIKVADNDTSAYMVAEGSIASFGMADSAAATNISVLSSGNVGIGKTNPAHKLDVAGGAQFNTTTGATPFYVTRSGAIDQALSIKVMDDNVRFESIQDETADNYGGFDFRMDGGTTEPDFVIRKNAGNPIFNVKGDGNVGIGTTSPDNILHIIKDQGGVASALKLENKAGADNSGFDIDFQLASSGLSAKIGAVRTNSDGAGDTDMFFSTSTNGSTATEAMRITHDGNVGIGTTSPTTTLEVKKVGSTADAGIRIDAGRSADFFIDRGTTSSRGVIDFLTASSRKWRVGNAASGTDDFQIFGANSNEFIIDRDTGNVGIGTTSPDEKLEVDGRIKLQTTAGSLVAQEFGAGSVKLTSSATLGVEAPSNFRVKTGPSLNENFTVLSTGNVGIGTTSPASLLHVAGTVQVGVDDTGHDVIFYGDTAGKKMLWQSSTNQLKLSDNVYLSLGDSGDLYARHTGGYGDISNNTGYFYIRNNANDSDIVFQADDGSGGVATYFYLDGSQATGGGTLFTKWGDNSYISLGDGSDLYFFHNGTDSKMQNSTGDLLFENYADDKDIIFTCDDGSGGVTPYLTIDGSASQVLSSVTLKSTPPNANTHSLVLGRADTGNVWNVNHAGNDFRLYNTAGSGSDILFGVNSGSQVVANKVGIGVATPASLLHVAGTVQVGVDDTGHDVKFFGATSGRYLLWDESADSLEFTDNAKAVFGDGNDMKLYHDASNSYITANGTGNLYIMQQATDADISFQSDDGSGGDAEYLRIDGGDEQVKVFKNLTLDDNIQAWFGSGNDLRIYHDASNSYIKQTGTGDLYIQNTTNDKDIIFQSDDGSGGVATYFYLDGGGALTRFDRKLRASDDVKIEAGSSGDLQIYHDASNSYIDQQGTGNLYIRNTQEDGLIYMQSNYNGSVSSFFYLHGAYSSNNPYTIFPDNSIAAFGNAADLRIKHDGSNSYIQQSGTGDLYFQQYNDDRDIVFQSDDGSGGITAYLTIDGSEGYTVANKNIRFQDNIEARFGSGNDMKLFHTGAYSMIQNLTGDLFIQNVADDKDVIFQSDDGSGGVETYFFLDGSSADANYNYTVFPDLSVAAFGNDKDLRLFHSSTNSYIQNLVGDLYIQNQANDKDIILLSDDGSGGHTAYLTLDGSAGHTVANKEIQFLDSIEATFGAANDLRIFHNGSHTYLSNQTGDLYIRNQADDKDIIFQSDDGSGGNATYLTLDGSAGTLEAAVPFNNTHAITSGGTITADTYFQSSDASAVLASQNNGSVFLRPNGIGSGTGAFSVSSAGKATVSGELEATSLDINGNADISGTLTVGVDDTGHDVKFYGATSGKYVEWDESSDCLRLADNTLVKFGYGNDLVIYHDGSNNHITADNGDLTFTVNENDHDIIFKSDDGSGGVTPYLTLDGGLGYTTVQKNIRFEDSVRAYFGNSNDGEILHNGTNFAIQNLTGGGDLKIINYVNDKDIILSSDDGSGGVTAYLTLDGSAGHSVANKEIQFLDNVVARFGTGNDLAIYHTGTATLFDNNVGDMKFRQYADDGDIIFQSDDGSGGLATYFFLDGGSVMTQFNERAMWLDNKAAEFGSSRDLKIYHDGSNSYIKNSGTGNLKIMGDNLYLQNTSGNSYIDGINGDRVEIKFNNSTKLATTNTGISVTGDVIASGNIVDGATQIKVLPHQFMSNEDGGANKSAQFRDDTIIGVRTSSNDAELYAFVEIPYGKTATNVTVYGNDTNLAVNVYESDINAGALTDKTPEAGCRVGAACDITDVAYSATNYLAIKVTTTNYTNDIVYGAVVTIT